MNKSLFITILLAGIVLICLTAVVDRAKGGAELPEKVSLLSAGAAASDPPAARTSPRVGKLAAANAAAVSVPKGGQRAAQGKDSVPSTPISQAPLEVKAILGVLVALFGLLAVFPMLTEKDEQGGQITKVSTRASG